MFTLRQFYKHLKRACDSFDKMSPNEQHKAVLKKLVYTIKIDSRLRVKAGEARMRTRNGVRSYSMRVSRVLMERATPEDQFQTISHELAHLLEYAIRGDSDHKALWQSLHLAMGGDAKRCHEIDVTDLRNTVKRVMVIDTKLNKKYYLRERAYFKQKMNLSLSNIEEPGRFKSQLVKVTRAQLKNA